MTIPALWLCVAGLLAPTSVVSAAAAAPVDRLEQAIDDYGRLRYDRARADLEQLLAEPGLPREREAAARMYLGLVLFTIGERLLSDNELKAALTLAPSLVLPADVSPKISKRFEELRALAVSGPGNVTTPSTAPSSAVPGEQSPSAAQPPLPGLSSAGRTSGGQLWTRVAGGLAVASAAAGSSLLLVAQADTREARRQTWADETRRLSDRAGSRALAGQLLLGTAGLLLVGSAVLYFVEGNSP